MSTTLQAEVLTLASSLDVNDVSAKVNHVIVSEVFPERLDDDAFYRVVLDSVTDNIGTIIRVLGGEVAVADTEPLDHALEFAALSAALRVPPSQIERAYRVGQAVFWNIWFEAASNHAEQAGLPVAEFIGPPSSLLFAYIDHILAPVLAHYDTERNELLRTREHLRRSVLPGVLDGSVADPGSDVDDALGYRLGDEHLFLLVEDETPPASALDVLADALGAPNRLVDRYGAASWQVWLGRAEPFDSAGLAKLRRALLATGLVATIGGTGSGLEGFRATQAQALEALRIRRAIGPHAPKVLWASEVRLEALLLRDEDSARRFVEEELGPLSGSDDRATRLRETLLAWLAAGSHVSAAAALQLHEHTVRNRIREAEELLPEPIMQRRAELQVALRLRRVLSPDAR